MMIEIKDLVKRYKDLTAVDHLNLNIKEGEIFGLLGPNGSGKTTTINCILSLLNFDSGEVKLFDKPMHANAYDIKKEIGAVFQNVAVFEELTVYENVNYFCGLYISDKVKRKKCVEDAIEFVGLDDFSKFYPKKLSGGLLRRLNIACGIAHKPKLIILDEPTVAVDPQSRNKILEGIVELNKMGATILYTSHYMEEVEQICTRMAIIDNGKVIAIGTADELKAMIDAGEKLTFEILENADVVLKKIKAMDFVLCAKLQENTLTINAKKDSHALLKMLEFFKTNKISTGKINSVLPTLNDVFLEITGKELRDNV